MSNFLLYFLFIMFIFLPSCKGQEKPVSKENNREKTINSKPEKKDDFDPYFRETKSITKSFGPIDITRNILQDKNGEYWLATWEGILKYDGFTFTNFTNKEKLRRHHVFSCLEDKEGNLWFGTIGGGIYFYDGKTFTNYSTDDSLANDRVLCFYEDKKGKIWIGTERGISVFQVNGFQNLFIEGDRDNNDINAIVENEEGEYWIGTRGKAFIYDGNNFTKIVRDNGTPFTNIRTIIKDSQGNMWLGGNDGLWRYDGKTFTNYTMEFVGYIYEDNKGNIWTSATVYGNSQQWVLNFYFKTIQN